MRRVAALRLSLTCVPPRLCEQAQERTKGEAPRYRGLVHALTLIPREEGFLVLWKGLLPRLLRIPPGQAITWAMADQIVGLYESSGH